MTAANYDIVIEQGADFALSSTLTLGELPVDLTGYTGRAQMRSKRSSTTIAGTFLVSIDTPLTGDVAMTMANSLTEALSPGRYVYDLEIYTAGDATVTRLLEGAVTVSAEVTR